MKQWHISHNIYRYATHLYKHEISSSKLTPTTPQKPPRISIVAW